MTTRLKIDDFRDFVRTTSESMDLALTKEIEDNAGGIRIVYKRVGKTLILECDHPEVPHATPKNRRVIKVESDPEELPKNRRLKLVK